MDRVLSYSLGRADTLPGILSHSWSQAWPPGLAPLVQIEFISSWGRCPASSFPCAGRVCGVYPLSPELQWWPLYPNLEGAALCPGAGVLAMEPLTGGQTLGTRLSLPKGDCPLKMKGWGTFQTPPFRSHRISVSLGQYLPSQANVRHSRRKN